MTRRSRNEGSIRRRKDGRWEARVHLGYHNGRRLRRSVYGVSRREVSDKLVVVQRDLQRGVVPPDQRLTVGLFAEQWLVAKGPSLRPRTRERYRQLLHLHGLPDLGHVRIAQLQPHHIQRLLNAKLDSGLSPQTVGHLRAVLRTMLADATKWGYTARNVASLVDAPRVTHREVRALTPAQARAVLDSVRGDRIEALITLTLATGVRQGEVLGLHWSDISLDDATLTVRQALQRSNGTYVFVEPKSAKSRRTLPIPTTVVACLRAHRVHQSEERLLAGERWTDLGLVFASSTGGPLNGTEVTKRFQVLLARAGLPRMRFHDLRHACASLLLSQGVPMRVVMETLGHSSIALTMNTYSHVIPDLMREAADRMDAVLATSG